MAGPDESLPIIPGAAGFGIETPAGSGRHVLNSKLAPGWDKNRVGYWSFDENTAKNDAEGGVAVKLEGDARLIDRGDGKALSVSGEGLLKLAKPDGYVKPGGSFTIMAWVKADNLGGSVVGCDMGGDRYWNLGLTRAQGGKWSFQVRQKKEKIHAEFKGSELGVWWLVSGVYDGPTGRIRLYVNGLQVHKGWNRGVKNLEASRSSMLVAGRGFKGNIDDIMLFDAALSEADIQAIYVHQYSSYHKAPADVYRVTNLDDSGPGSLREGLESQNRARTIVFEVSGNISLRAPLVLKAQKNSWLTIAGETAPSPGITIKDDMINGKTFASVADIWKQVQNPFKDGAQPEICRAKESPVTVPGLKIKPAKDVKEWVLAHVGARPADRDPVDERIIENIRTGEGKLPIASQREVGGWPELVENRRELTVPENPYADDDGDGYTNLEEWLHAFAAEVEEKD